MSSLGPLTLQEAGRVAVPVLLIHGEKDPDFKDVRVEGEEVKACLTSSPRVEVSEERWTMGCLHRAMVLQGTL